MQAEGEVVVVLVGVGALGDLGQVVLEVRGPRRRRGGRVRGQVRVVVRVVRLQSDRFPFGFIDIMWPKADEHDSEADS